MQILREALLEQLSTPIIQFKVLRNKILCLTQYQLVLLSIHSGCKKIQIPYIGSNVRSIQMSKDYIAILERNGLLQIRRLDNLKELLMIQKNVKIINSRYPKLKWSEDELYLVYEKNCIKVNVLQKEMKTITPPFNIQKSQQLVEVQFSDLFAGLKSVFYILKSSIHLCVDNIKVGMKQFQDLQVKQVLKLCHPLQLSEVNKQYLVVLVQSTMNSSFNHKRMYLKVYNILNMQLIFSKELAKQNDCQLQVLSDELCEYILIKHEKKKSLHNQEKIQSQNLLKINSEYYYSSLVQYNEDMQPFFLFDIEIGLGKDLKLFPSHMEEIKGKLCNSIDTCYFQKNQVCIASIVLEASYKNDIYKQYKDIEIVSPELDEKQSSKGLLVWKQIVQAKIHPNRFIQKLLKKSSLRNKKQNKQSFPFDIHSEHEQAIQILLNNLAKINKFNQSDMSQAQQTIKNILAIQYYPMLTDVMSIQRDQNKTRRQLLQKGNEDFANTMSGCSSSLPVSPRSGQSFHPKAVDEGLQLVINQQLNEQREDVLNQMEQFQQDCDQCQQIEDHQNLEQTLDIVNESSRKAEGHLANIEQSIFRMEKLCLNRLQRVERKSQKDKKNEQDVFSFIEKQFKSSLDRIQSNLVNSAEKFNLKLSLRPSVCTQELLDKKDQFIQTITDKRLLHQNQAKLHQDNHEEILDYFYDIEFPEIGFETYDRFEKSTASFWQLLSRNQKQKEIPVAKGLDQTITVMGLNRDDNDEEFRLFSEFIFKNFM